MHVTVLHFNALYFSLFAAAVCRDLLSCLSLTRYALSCFCCCDLHISSIFTSGPLTWRFPFSEQRNIPLWPSCVALPMLALLFCRCHCLTSVFFPLMSCFPHYLISFLSILNFTGCKQCIWVFSSSLTVTDISQSHIFNYHGSPVRLFSHRTRCRRYCMSKWQKDSVCVSLFSLH